MDRRAWGATVYGVAKSQTRLSDFCFTVTSLSFVWLTLDLKNLAQMQLPLKKVLNFIQRKAVPLTVPCAS